MSLFFLGNKSIAVPHRKHTRDMEIVDIPIPKRVVISMQQHIGATCTPVVSKGDYVQVGQLIGNSDQCLSAPIHSSVSGNVNEIIDMLMSDGKHIPAIVIDCDGLQTLSSEIKKPVINTKEDFINAVRLSGSVGLGGAGFPTSVKLSIPKDAKVDTLLINAAECEPYITVDYRECIEGPDNIVNGIKAIQKYLDIPNAILVTEDNKSEIIENFKQRGIKTIQLKSVYPQGAEKLLVYNTLKRVIPVGGFPYSIGALVINVNTVSFIARYLETGIPLITKTITVDGKAINNPSNVRVPIGTSVKDIENFCGGCVETPSKIIMGGPMMGVASYTDEIYIMKQHNAVLFFNKEEAYIPEQKPCIRCGRCLDACPMSLMPCELAKQHLIGDYSAMLDYSIMSCIECGACAYSCPAGRNLVQIYRLAKAEIRKKGLERK